MASGIARVHVGKTAAAATAELPEMAAMLRLIWFITFFFNIPHPCYHVMVN